MPNFTAVSRRSLSGYDCRINCAPRQSAATTAKFSKKVKRPICFIRAEFDKGLFLSSPKSRARIPDSIRIYAIQIE